MTEATPTDLGAARRKEALGLAIRVARGEMTQAELGALMGTLQTTVSRWELGLVDLAVEQVHGLEAVLGLRPGTLLRVAGYVAGERQQLGSPLRLIEYGMAEEAFDAVRAADELGFGVSLTNVLREEGDPVVLDEVREVSVWGEVPGATF